MWKIGELMRQHKDLKKIAKYLLVLIAVVALVTIGGWYIYKNTLFTGYLYLNYWFKLYVKTYAKELLFASFVMCILIMLIYNQGKIVTKMERLSDEKKSYLVMGILFIVGTLVIYGGYLFGGKFFIFTDAGLDTAASYYPAYMQVAQSIREGNLSLWNFYGVLGCDTLTRQEWLMDPFGATVILLGVILGTWVIRYAIIAMQIIKIFIAMFFCYKFLGYYRFDWYVKSLASFVYAFCGYMMLWGQHYYFGTAVVYLALLLWVVEHFLATRTNKSVVLVSIVTALTMIYSGYFGYMILVFGSIYVFVRLAYLNVNGSWKTYWNMLWPLVVSVIIGIAISGVMLLPFAELTISVSDRMNTNVTFMDKLKLAWEEKFSLEYYLSMATRIVSNSLMGIQGIYQEYYEYPQLSFSLFNVIILPQFLWAWFRKKENGKRNILKVAIVLLIVFALAHPFVSFLFSAFGTITKRWTYVLMPLFALAYAYFIQNQLMQKKCNYILLVISFMVVYALSAWGYKSFKIEYRSVNSVVVIMNVLFILCIIIWQVKDSRFFLTCAITLLLMGTIYEGFVCNNLRTTYTKEMFNDKNVSQIKEIIAQINDEDNSFYRMEKTYYDFSITGDPSVEMYHPATMYSSTMSSELTNFYRKMYCSGKKGTYDYLVLDDNMKIPVLSLINVKYLLSKDELNYDNFVEIKKVGDVHVYRNTDAKSIGILYDNLMSEAQFEGLDPERRNEYLSRYLIVEEFDEVIDLDINTKESNAFKSNTCNFKLKGQNKIVGDVNVNQDNQWLFLSVPWRNGWNLYVDGVKTEIIHADYGFMAAKVSRGEHAVELKYENPIYLYGLFVSIVGIMLLIAYGHIYGRRFT